MGARPRHLFVAQPGGRARGRAARRAQHFGAHRRRRRPRGDHLCDLLRAPIAPPARAEAPGASARARAGARHGGHHLTERVRQALLEADGVHERLRLCAAVLIEVSARRRARAQWLGAVGRWSGAARLRRLGVPLSWSCARTALGHPPYCSRRTPAHFPLSFAQASECSRPYAMRCSTSPCPCARSCRRRTACGPPRSRGSSSAGSNRSSSDDMKSQSRRGIYTAFLHRTTLCASTAARVTSATATR